MMDWIQFAIFFVGIVGLFIWNRTESRADNRHMDTKLEGQRNLMNALVETMRFIENEQRDFHNKLLEIEKNRR